MNKTEKAWEELKLNIILALKIPLLVALINRGIKRFKLSWVGRKVFKNKAVPNPLKVSALRNLTCFCGSGKKIKKCCGRADYVDEKWAKDTVKAVREWLK